jgi:hypothetical protein
MLGIASGLFDFFSTYKEPPPPEEVVEESSVEMVIPPILAGDSDTAKGDDADGEGSDTDDLFASRSPTPEEAKVSVPNGNDTGHEGHKGSNGSSRRQSPPRIILDDDVDMDIRPSPMPMYSSKVSSVGMDDMNGVTEDDFDFFDGPADAEGEDGKTNAHDINRPGKEDGSSAAQLAPEVPVLVKDFAFTDSPAHLDMVKQNGEPTAAPLDDMVEADGDSAIDTESAPMDDFEADGTDVTAIDTIISSPILIDPSPKPSDISDLIPPDFSPLPLETIRLSASLRPTTDVPLTAQDLRSELLARLKEQYSKHTKADYHDGWKANEDVSDQEADDLGTDAPTTPASSDMWDESTIQSGDEKEVAEGSADVEYDGVPCIGAEWFYAVGDTAVLGVLGRKWKDAWGSLPEPQVMMGEESKPVVRDGMERMAREIVCNRYYRDLHAVPGTRRARSVKHDLAGTGMTLDALVADTGITALDTSAVHVGFAGNVMRIDASGLGFWRQLGLSPVGGEKDVTSVAICLPGDGNMQLADVLLKGVERAWASMRLGKHVARAQSRVVISELHTIAGSLSKINNHF